MAQGLDERLHADRCQPLDQRAIEDAGVEVLCIDSPRIADIEREIARRGQHEERIENRDRVVILWRGDQQVLTRADAAHQSLRDLAGHQVVFDELAERSTSPGDAFPDEHDLQAHRRTDDSPEHIADQHLKRMVVVIPARHLREEVGESEHVLGLQGVAVRTAARIAPKVDVATWQHEHVIDLRVTEDGVDLRDDVVG
ncbi:MAG: hypothetical protein CO108_00590 [Deltaproteobacteria bacterium CG_4_9_14_3_um_filter_63_12]|nr:MAG: hypothetical protein COW42_09660 [Deltaproteobacteria bacterium CG17_big_fil_post_rev_8_21_14_2_50_63_7]PJB49216.1 MAG: hypothetical protein CO108_00590 [Deltaproteobacteria bacterium CG_4_9_14_3_um_filter_63_12]